MKLAVALVPIVALLACGSPSNSAKAEPSVNQQIIDRYTHDIWPAMSAYNADHAQAGKAAKQFFAVADPNLVGDQVDTLRSAAQGMGRQGEYDAQDQTSHYNDGLTLRTVDVQSVKERRGRAERLLHLQPLLVRERRQHQARRGGVADHGQVGER